MKKTNQLLLLLSPFERPLHKNLILHGKKSKHFFSIFLPQFSFLGRIADTTVVFVFFCIYQIFVENYSNKYYIPNFMLK